MDDTAEPLLEGDKYHGKITLRSGHGGPAQAVVYEYGLEASALRCDYYHMASTTSLTRRLNRKRVASKAEN